MARPRGIFSSRAPSALGSDLQLARLLVRRGLLSSTDAAHCLRHLQHAQPQPPGAATSLRQILLDRGLITAEILDSITPEQPVPPMEIYSPPGENTQAAENSWENAPVEVREAAQQPERRLGHYVLLEKLGAGGMGVVQRAWDPRLRRFVAVKTVLASLVRNPRIRQRFEREGRAAARLCHSGIVGVLDCHFDGPQPFYVMPFVEGTCLRTLLLQPDATGRYGLDATPRALPEPRIAASVVRRVAIAMAHAHHSHVVHRDLKPDNIIIDRRGLPHVIDFGVSLLTRAASSQQIARLTTPGRTLGTPAYMSPEQIADAHLVDARTDVYALGAILYECLSGDPPFGPGHAHPLEMFRRIAMDPPPPLRQRHPDIPEQLEEICLRCLEKCPDHRYPSAAELADDLDCWMRGSANQHGPVSLPRRLWDKTSGSKLGIVTALIAAPLLAVSLPAANPPQHPASLTAPPAITVAKPPRKPPVTGRNTADARRILSVLRPTDALHAKLTALDMALSIAPDLLDARVQRAAARRDLALWSAKSLQEKRRITESALADLSHVLAQQPEHVPALHERACIHRLLLSDTDASRRDLLRVTRLDPLGWRGKHAAATLQATDGKLLQAEQLLNDALDLRPRHPQLLVSRAVLRWVRNDHRDAMFDAETCLAIHPGQVAALNLELLSRTRQGESPTEALAALQKILKIAPQAPALHVSRAILLLRLGDLAASEASARHAISLNPHDSWAHEVLGNTLAAASRHPEAVRAFNDARALGNTNIGLAVTHSRSLLLSGKPSEAETALSEALRDSAGRHHPSDRWPTMIQLIPLDPTRFRAAELVPQVWLLRGVARASLGRPDAARDDLDEALRLEPSLAAAYAHRARLHLRAGRRDAARADLEALVRAAPDTPDATWARSQLAKLQAQ